MREKNILNNSDWAERLTNRNFSFLNLKKSLKHDSPVKIRAWIIFSISRKIWFEYVLPFFGGVKSQPKLWWQQFHLSMGIFTLNSIKIFIIYLLLLSKKQVICRIWELFLLKALILSPYVWNFDVTFSFCFLLLKLISNIVNLVSFLRHRIWLCWLLEWLFLQAAFHCQFSVNGGWQRKNSP